MILLYEINFPDEVSRFFLGVVIVLLIVAIVAVLCLPNKRG